MKDLITDANAWLSDESEVAALTMHQWLEPVDGKGSIIFPPTYAKPERMKDEDWGGYNIDKFQDGSTICQLDSIGSQANRMEPLFKREPYKNLIPEVTITFIDRNADNIEREISLLDAGHRAADAIIRFSTIGASFDEAFRAYKYKGDAEPLTRLAPTSIVFGCWDSRATQVKLPRIVRSVIRAYNVKPLHRSAQYATIAGEILEGGDAEVTTKGVKAELGLAHVPAAWTPGGIKVDGEIRREAIINLSALRALESSVSRNRTLELRKYVLSLALVSLCEKMDLSLREGCYLVPDASHPRECKAVRYDGTREDIALSIDQSLAFARSAAESFGVDNKPIRGKFDPDLAKKVSALPEKDRKLILRRGAVTSEAIEKMKKRAKPADEENEG